LQNYCLELFFSVLAALFFAKKLQNCDTNPQMYLFRKKWLTFRLADGTIRVSGVRRVAAERVVALPDVGTVWRFARCARNPNGRAVDAKKSVSQQLVVNGKMAAAASAASVIVVIVVIFHLFVEIVCAGSQVIRHQKPVFNVYGNNK
jgi:hypothetical protein